MNCKWHIDENCPIWCYPRLLNTLSLKGWHEDNIVLLHKDSYTDGYNRYILKYNKLSMAILYLNNIATENKMATFKKEPFHFYFDKTSIVLFIVCNNQYITIAHSDFPNPKQLYLLYCIFYNKTSLNDFVQKCIKEFINYTCCFAGLGSILLCEVARQIATSISLFSKRVIYIDKSGNWFSNNEYLSQKELLQLMSYNKTNTHSLEENGYDDKADFTAVITESEATEGIIEFLKQNSYICKIIVITNSPNINFTNNQYIDGYSLIDKLSNIKPKDHNNSLFHRDIGNNNDNPIEKRKIYNDASQELIHIPEMNEHWAYKRNKQITDNNNLNFSTMARQTSFEHQIELAESLKSYLHGFQERLGEVAKNYKNKSKELYEAGMMDEMHHDFEQNYMHETIISIAKVVERINDCDIPFVEKYIDELENLMESHRR